MTPTLVDILRGQAAALAAPQPPEAGGDYLAGRLGVLAVLAALAVQEAEGGVAARVRENAALRQVLARASDAYDDAFCGALATAAAAPPGDLTLSALDADNAALRRRLIALHEAAEARGDAALDGEILELYVVMADARRLELPE
jgi:hypothetical protein